MRALLIASGYIADSVHSVGSILDSPTGRAVLGVGDYAYVKTDSPAKVGVKFYVIRPVEKVIHPKSGKMLGYLIDVLGIAEIVGQDGNEMKVKIIASYSDIFTGSLLDSYYELEPPYRLETPRKPDIDGYIVAAKEIRTFNGMLDIVYLDKGRREGLEVGDVCATLLQGKRQNSKQHYSGYKHQGGNCNCNCQCFLELGEFIEEISTISEALLLYFY